MQNAEGHRQVQDTDFSSKIRVAEIKSKINGKPTGKGQRMVPGEMDGKGLRELVLGLSM